MAKASFKSVDQYIVAKPEPAQAALQRVRKSIRSALPGADEIISYNIPAYRVSGAVVIFFAGWKQHYSLYPAGPLLIEAFKDELAGCTISKGTIRFPLSKPVPTALIARIAKFRAKEMEQRAGASLSKNAGGRAKSKS
ncbi:MAG: DUF1801 domain-containing protein [Acidobacteria bacterium]|nr:DUF1801 domain-containing protein [Acidobacteriota bacterium]